MEDKPLGKSGNYMQLTVVVAAVAIGAFLLFKFLIWPVIWWIISIIGIFVLALNYKLVLRVLKWIRGLYKKNVWMGVGATIGGFLAFTPLMGFLFLKTIWDFRKSKSTSKNSRDNTTIDAEFIEESSDDVIMDKLNWIEDKLPFKEEVKREPIREEEPEERRPNSHLPPPPDLQ